MNNIKKVFILIDVFFEINANAQKAYEMLVYNGVWGNFNITLNYAYVY